MSVWNWLKLGTCNNWEWPITDHVVFLSYTEVVFHLQLFMHVFQDNKKNRFFKVTVQFEWCFRLKDPGAPLTNFNDGGGGGGGGRQRFIFYTQKLHNFRICLPKKKNHYFFKHSHKNFLVLFSQPKKIPLFFFRDPKKNPGVFHRTKKSLSGQNLRPKKITRTHPPPPPPPPPSAPLRH